MEASRVTLLTLLCVVFYSQQRIFGAEVEMRVRPGENVIIYSYCYSETEPGASWFRTSSGRQQPHLLITRTDVTKCAGLPHYSLLWNICNTTVDLLIRNVNKSDQGLYYCGSINAAGVHSYGSRSTRLVILEEAPPPTREPCEPVSQGTLRVETPPPSREPCELSASENGSPGWCCSWQLLVSVSAGCVLLSSLFSSIGVYYLCRKNLKAEVRADRGGSDKRPKPRSDEGIDTEVCYSSLDFQNINQKKQKQRVQHSDFSTYSEVRTPRH